MPRNFSVEPPKIPGLVYNGRRQKLQFLILVAGVIVVLVYLSRSMSTHELLIDGALSAGALGLVYLTYRKNPNSVYMDQHSVRADFGNGIVVNEPLDNYCIGIGQALKSSPMTQNYCYRIFLAPKNNLPIKQLDGTITQPQSGLNKREIPVRDRILTPQNLKENVEAIQRQIASPLKLVFTSEQLERDYISGRFKA